MRLNFLILIQPALDLQTGLMISSHKRLAGFLTTVNNIDSCGCIAHSQGGAACLHLYTYYWSCLDYGSDNRMIQSVWTPYQGTALARKLAAIGDVFGSGCGTNQDLTYSGASTWLSGVYSLARSEVHYFTTSFKDNWWSYDYCHIVTDAILGDPDYGATEKAYGQLSGDNNRGHKTGWESNPPISKL